MKKRAGSKMYLPEKTLATETSTEKSVLFVFYLSLIIKENLDE